MAETEGVIQYRLDHRPGKLPAGPDYPGLFDWFRRCHKLGLIGQDPARYEGYAYGNISVRASRGFVISGTQTGGQSALREQDLAWVTEFDIAHNRLHATGPSRPSSEAMTHGAVYRNLPAIDAVIHVHSPKIWGAATRLGLPCTAAEAGYGTPAMADEVAALLARQPDGGVLVMGGHEDGVIAYGHDMASAGTRLMAILSDVDGTADHASP